MAQARRTKAQKQVAFLDAYRNCYVQSMALEEADVTVKEVKGWIENDARFVTALNDAKDYVADRLEQVAMQRGMAESDTLLIFMLKGLRPEKFTQNKTETTLKADESLRAVFEGLAPTVGPPARRESA